MKNSLLTIVLLSMAACNGDISLFGDGNTEFGNQTPIGKTLTEKEKEIDTKGKIPRGDNNGVVPDEDICRFINPGTTPLRRLTKLEYNNSLQDLFPNLAIPFQNLADDERVGSFDANTTSAVDLVIAEQYMGAAESVAEIAITDLDAYCSGACDLQWALNLGERAFRRPLNEQETTGLTTLFETTETKFNNEAAVRMTVEAILQSSAFLYRAELGEDSTAEVTKLTQFELASRLSYFLAGTIPDASLIDAAKNGKLSDAAEIEAEARRILESTKGRDRINAAMSTWLGVGHIEEVDRDGLTSDQQSALLMESQTFIDTVMQGDATLDELLTADYAFVSKENEDLYGVEVDGDFERVQLPAERRGILGHPSFLASHGAGQAIVHRGKFIKDAFLCLNTQPPPAVLIPLPTFEGESGRSKADKRIAATEEGCATCHAVVDGIGKVFDPFDEDGRYQTQDVFGNPLTSDGTVLGSDFDGEFNGMGELAEAMASSKNVRSCVTKQFLSYSLGRLTSTADDACTLLGMQKALDLSNGNLKEMLIAVVVTDAFRYRRKLELGDDQ